MRITMVSGVAGTRYSYEPGQTVDHDDSAQAVRWIERGIAVPAKPAPEVRVVGAPEYAVFRSLRTRIEQGAAEAVRADRRGFTL
jgi:hypothetical protein